MGSRSEKVGEDWVILGIGGGIREEVDTRNISGRKKDVNRGKTKMVHKEL